MPTYNFSIVRDTARVNELPKNLEVELLAKDGKIRANQILLQVASPFIHKAIMENKTTLFDLKNYSQEAVVGLLDMIYSGRLTVTDHKKMDEVMRLAQDLEVKFELNQGLPEGENIKVGAPKAPEEPREDPGLIKMENGRIGCGICFKTFKAMAFGTRHYQEQHMIDKKIKNIKCRAPNCNKKFAIERNMKVHMKQAHGISSKMLKSTKTVKVPQVPKIPRKNLKEELPEH